MDLSLEEPRLAQSKNQRWRLLFLSDSVRGVACAFQFGVGGLGFGAFFLMLYFEEDSFLVENAVTTFLVSK